MLQHPAFANDIPHALGAHNLIFADVLQSKGEAAVFPLNNANFAESAFADNAKKSEVIEIHLVGEENRFAIRIAHGLRLAYEPSLMVAIGPRVLLDIANA